MDYLGKVCPYCKSKIVEGDDVVICSLCEMPHHKECWIENKACTTFGCMGTILDPGLSSQVMRFCTDCGNPIRAGQKFCTQCGMALRGECVPPVAQTAAIPSLEVKQPTASGEAVQSMQQAMPLQDSVPTETPTAEPCELSGNADPLHCFVPKEKKQEPMPPQVQAQAWLYGENMQEEETQEDKLLSAFLHGNTYYLNTFKKMKAQNSSLSWNWSAFFFGTLWFVYRKMYGFGTIYMLVVHLINYIPNMGRPLQLLFYGLAGVFGNYVYMQNALGEIKRVQDLDDYNRMVQLDRKGGSSLRGVFVFLAILSIIIFLHLLWSTY